MTLNSNNTKISISERCKLINPIPKEQEYEQRNSSLWHVGLVKLRW